MVSKQQDRGITALSFLPKQQLLVSAAWDAQLRSVSTHEPGPPQCYANEGAEPFVALCADVPAAQVRYKLNDVRRGHAKERSLTCCYAQGCGPPDRRCRCRCCVALQIQWLGCCVLCAQLGSFQGIHNLRISSSTWGACNSAALSLICSRLSCRCSL